MRKPQKAMAVKVDWQQYKKLKDEALEEDKPISKLLSDILEAHYGDEQAEAEFACPECDFEAKSKAGLARHWQAKHSDRGDE